MLYQSSRDHCTEEVLDSFLRLTNYLVSHPVGTSLIRNVFDCVLFNPSLWIYSPYKVRTTASRAAVSNHVAAWIDMYESMCI